MRVGVIVTLIVAAAATISLSGCPKTCGNISIPYPFGIGTGCFMEGFSLTCSNSSNPPKLTLGDGTIQVLNISLPDGTVRINSNRFTLFDNFSTQDPALWRGLHESYSFSGTRNLFAAVGCNILVNLLSPSVDQPVSSCESVCGQSVSYLPAPSVFYSGSGCCQSPFDEDIKNFDVQIQLLEQNSNPEGARDFTNKAFIVEQDAYQFSQEDPYLSRDEWESRVIPAVLDWSFDGMVNTGNCEQSNNYSRYACPSSNSKCYFSLDREWVQYCNCSQGFEGNPYIAGGCEVHPPEILIGVSISIGVLLLLLVIALLSKKLKERRAKNLKEKYFRQNKGLLLQNLISSNNDAAERVKIFTSEELEKATNYFDRTRILGHGGHGTVYKGILLDLRVVAIKKSNINVQSEIDQFINEVVILTQINHRNVVKLFGCCLETEVPLLVYEFVSNGTLSQHLHATNGLSLPWDDRLRIAIETARALAYLHTAASLSVFHRDVKSANILLDDALTAKVSDFGASRSVPLDHTRITTAIQGTFGYLDPEYFHTSQLTEKSDVYSFGVILVELLTGQKAVSNSILPEGRNLATHFLCSLKDNCHSHLLEARVVEEGDDAELESVANLAETCLRLKGEERPTIKEVEVRLEALRDSKIQSQRTRDAQRLELFPGPPMHRKGSSVTTRLFSLEKELLESANFPR